jgi:hypothetical protein
MGMYATIQGEEVKFLNTLAVACSKIGLNPVNGTMVLPRDKVEGIIYHMVESIEASPRLRHNDGWVDSDKLFRLSAEARTCGLLISWLVNSRGDSILFA